jgi:hypothetical protein
MVVDALRGGDPCPSTGISAARTSWVMDQLLHGASVRLDQIPAQPG